MAIENQLSLTQGLLVDRLIIRMAETLPLLAIEACYVSDSDTPQDTIYLVGPPCVPPRHTGRAIDEEAANPSMAA